MLRKNFTALLIFSILISFHSFVTFSFAQSSVGYSYSVQIDTGAGVPGDIVVYVNGKYVLSTIPYDQAIFGVITASSVVSLEDTNIPAENSKQLLSAGETVVRVNSSEGNIQKGDYITTSSQQGVGTKATKSGYVVGTALEDYSSDDKNAVGTIRVYVNIQSVYIQNNVRVNLIEALRGGTMAPFITPITSMRYLLAVLVITASFIIGFRSFGKSSSGSIEALGRNPLAKNTIKSAVVFNFVLTFVVMLLGIVFSYLILVL